MMPLPGFQNPTPYLAPAVAKNSYTSLFKSYAKKKKSKIRFIFNILNPNISNTIDVFWVGSPQQYLFYSKTTYPR